MSQDLEKARNLTQLVYFLYIASVLAGVTAVIAIINYLKRDEVAGIWAIYRIVKGMLNFYDYKPMYQDA